MTQKVFLEAYQFRQKQSLPSGCLGNQRDAHMGTGGSEGQGMKQGQKHTGKYCSCEQELSSWDLRCSKALSYKNPVCESCMAKEYDRTVEEIRDTLEGYFGMRPCQGL